VVAAVASLQFNMSFSERRRRAAYQASQSFEKGSSSRGGTYRLRSALAEPSPRRREALGHRCALLVGSPPVFVLSLLLGSPPGFALSLLLGREVGVCGSLPDPVKLLGSLELLAGLRPREKAA
jgi:hypothetical protein